MAKSNRVCELCDGVADLYCAADEAHICWTCDAKVHSANFLVARHTRLVLCEICGIQTPWKASGGNPTPLTGLCAECSQGESQDECTTHSHGGVIDTSRVTVRAHPIAGCADSGYESGCSSSKPESCESAVIVEMDLVQTSPCESSISQLSSEDMEGITVDSRGAQGSVSLGIPKSLKRKRSLDCFLPVSVPLSKQIVVSTLEDDMRSVAHGQCECDSTASFSSSTRRVSHANQDPSFEARDWNRPQSQEVESSNRDLTNLLLSSAKRQRVDRTQIRASFTRTQQSAVFSTSRVMRMLAKWHWDLHLSSPGTVPLALRMFRKISRAMAPTVLSNSGMRITLAACLHLASSLDEAQITVPRTSEVAGCAGVSTRKLATAEIHLLALLGWRSFPVRAGSRT
ncbi:uncharacterized protein [Physcomitrium patens]|uniref:B box-type domain-containing protein n=1 Tax=Physcomitrium patens TaxID=3218 RepID=A0A2K1L765_PHYPA|nr:zinc finger protein CONSTANS-LIKE 10-like [Physcomitrium patens]PNR61879.1 hypothetical protein PHYPA_000303 [Physcomitrium patens]|eukprot:XP_024379997.1 zinc finger protein CONSTANS-LIKE 10-like [Physcomitrella patens]